MQRRSLLLVAPWQLEWVEEELPALMPNEVLVQTIAGAVSVGSELPLYRGDHRGSQPISYPRMTGYESLARVLACSIAVQNVSAGDRVVSTYGHRSHDVLKETALIPVPGDIAGPAALLSILSCDVTKGITKMNVQPHDRVMITGAGTIGLLTLFNLKARGVITVDVIEPLATRRDLALRLGATTAFAPNEAPPDEERYQAAFECSSRDQAFNLLQQRMIHGGRICILADGNIEPLVLSPRFHEQELMVVGSSDGEDYPGHARWFFDRARGSSETLERLYEIETTANELPTVFEQIAQASIPPMKVLVRY